MQRAYATQRCTRLCTTSLRWNESGLPAMIAMRDNRTGVMNSLREPASLSRLPASEHRTRSILIALFARPRCSRKKGRDLNRLKSPSTRACLPVRRRGRDRGRSGGGGASNERVYYNSGVFEYALNAICNSKTCTRKL